MYGLGEVKRQTRRTVFGIKKGEDFPVISGPLGRVLVMKNLFIKGGVFEAKRRKGKGGVKRQREASWSDTRQVEQSRGKGGVAGP